MSLVLDSNSPAAQPLRSLVGASAANEDLLPAVKAAHNNNETGGWDAYDVWRRLIKEARDRRDGLVL